MLRKKNAAEQSKETNGLPYKLGQEVWVVSGGLDQHTVQGFIKEIRGSNVLVELGTGLVIVIPESLEPSIILPPED